MPDYKGSFAKFLDLQYSYVEIHNFSDLFATAFGISLWNINRDYDLCKQLMDIPEEECLEYFTTVMTTVSILIEKVRVQHAVI